MSEKDAKSPHISVANFPDISIVRQESCNDVFGKSQSFLGKIRYF